MTVRVGVDVGGTFTKAVAYDVTAGRVVAEQIVATTHDASDGVAAGVVRVVTALAQQLGADSVEMVTHSTTQAVNALLEGDVATVGMVGMGSSPDLRKSRQRTVDTKIEVTAGRALPTVTEFLDVTHGLTAEDAAAAVDRLVLAGAEAVSVAEAFAPDDSSNEALIRDAAVARGLPVSTGAELTGLYGLELRSVSAALNASILPIAMRTAEVVASGVTAAGISGPVMVMRGDGGATDLAGFRAAPARTLYSGPAASVAGVLRTAKLQDAVVLEVGGTSSNVAAVRRGRPGLSYVQVASHSTAVRSVDVRVLGVAGGSMLRVRRHQVYGVGPRSAHIAGCVYTCFLRPEDLAGATLGLEAPRAGDPADYVVLHLADGRKAALTTTCAANALGLVPDGDYAKGAADAALAGFSVVAATMRISAEEVARRMLQACAQTLGDLVTSVIKSQRLERPVLVAVGGGAGALGRVLARAMGLELVIPPHAEVISAVGDALSLIRAEAERPSADDLDALIAEVEAEAVAAGASPADLDVRVEQLTDRGGVRVTVTGAVALETGAVPGRAAVSAADIAFAERGYGEPVLRGDFWFAEVPDRVAVWDRYGDLVLDVTGEVVSSDLESAIARRSRRIGPMTSPPDAWLMAGPRAVQLDVSTLSDVPPDGLLVLGRE
ncbi:MAG: hydantoinase/oxoprolinase [Frankiales bacterium]|nr:hydantoinase/oxoprolinase [Frankiales bacterium]